MKHRKEMLERILETVNAYYLTNEDVLSEEEKEDLQEQIDYLNNILDA